MAETKFFLNLPFTKVNEEERTVEGLATTDAIDKQGEQVDFDASKEAFKDWTGNIREMHEPKAVGKAISWTPDEEHRGIRVKAHISKGAEDTWQKIKDGTLKAFSIGGQTVHKVSQVVKDMDGTGGQRNVTRITKYKLTELSLVDNPANPHATIELVKSVDGVPTQTESVEDIQKVLISEASDILEDEVAEHRSKADSLVKKVIPAEELEKLDSEHWGVVRKFERDGKHFIERFLPMPDKVHAVRALSIAGKYNLNEEENNRVHELAKSILGSDYEFYSSLANRGGELKKMNKDIMDAIASLTKKVADLEAKFSKVDAGKPDSEVATQEEGNVAPKKTGDKEADGKFEGEVPTEGEKHELPDVDAADGGEKPIKTQEEGNVAPKHSDDKDAGGDFEGEVPTEGTKQALPDVGAKGAKTSLKTQEEGNVAPVKKQSLAPAKKQEIKKGEEDALAKEIQTLRKRVEELESAPMPRKYRKIEKNFGSEGAVVADTLAEDREKCLELRKQEQAGRKLTTEEKSFIDSTLKKSFDAKFNKSL